jgi:DNA-binding SARP family transcriptional activator
MAPAVPQPPRLLVLGTFELHFDGEPLRLSGPAQRLLAYLAISNNRRSVRRTSLAERLWDVTTPDRASSNLRSVLWRLPRPRGRQLVVSDASSVRLSDDMDVDLWQAEELVATICGSSPPPGEALQDLSSLNEDLLPDWHDDWLLVERESYRQKRLHALERSSAHLRQHGQFNASLSAALTAVHCEPLRESAHRRVIEVHLDEGNHAEALRQFESYRRLVARELGLPPSPAIRELVAPLVGRPVDVRRSRRAR